MANRTVRVKSSTKTASALLAEIVEGTLAPGTPLTETKLAARLGVSRTPIREAVARLVALGLLERRSSHGLRVTPFSFEDAVEILLVREELEALAVRLSGRLMSRERLLALRQKLKSPAAGAREGNGRIQGRRLEQGTRFHDLVATLPLSPLLRQLFEVLRPHALRERYYAWDIWPAQRHLSRWTNREHIEILDAMLVGDMEGAERLVRRHIRRVREGLVRHFGKQWGVKGGRGVAWPEETSREERRARGNKGVDEHMVGK
jgi:DNA-binding GntR family transcriptional regulator